MALSIATIVFATATRNTLRDALDTAINAGGATAPGLRLFTSNGGTLLADIPLDNTDAFTASSPGLLTCVVPQTVNGAATGVPTYWELVPQVGSSANLIASGTITGPDTINSGQPVNLTSFTITISA